MTTTDTTWCRCCRQRVPVAEIGADGTCSGCSAIEPTESQIGRAMADFGASVEVGSGQLAQVEPGRWEQSRETFERLGYLTAEERADMWAALEDFEGRWPGEFMAVAGRTS